MAARRATTAALLAFMAVTGEGTWSAERHARELPNVVLILADDMGWGDLGVNNEQQASETPRMDALATAGIRMSDMHAGASVCTPARAAILTGRLGPRTGVKKNFAQSSLYGLSLQELTLAELLKTAAVPYDTLSVGKWHLGHADQYQPSSRGFDGWFGVPYSWDLGCADGTNGVDWHDGVCSTSHKRYGCPTWWGDDVMCSGCAAQSPGIPVFLDYTIVEQPANLSMLTDRMTAFSTEFILAHTVTDSVNDTAPFFLYFAATHVHAPVAYHPKYLNTSTAKTVFADSLRELDSSIGAIADAVAEAGQTESTLIVFTSDNGPWNIKCDWTERQDGLAGSAGPFEGAYQTSTLGGGGASGKFTSWEGGHRVPTFMVWPGKISPGQVDDHLLSHADIVPTVANLAGVELPTDRIYDGVDLTPLLFANGSSSEDPFAYHRYLLHDIAPYSLEQTDNVQAVRVGKFKVFFSHCGASACNEIYYTCSRDGRPNKRTLVFDLKSDPAESTPLDFASDPEAALALVEARAVLRSFKSSLDDDFYGDTDFAHGSHPDSWPCCNPDNLSCRCGEAIGPTSSLEGKAKGRARKVAGLVEALRAEGLLSQREFDGLISKAAELES